jgi:5'-3' exonuclease
MPKTIALIDADSILYAVASSAEICARKQGEDGEDLWFPKQDLETSYKGVVNRLDELVDTLKATDAYVCLSASGETFRHAILPTYKANRAFVRRPQQLVDLQAMVSERRPHPVTRFKALEADDVCGIYSGWLQRAGGCYPIIVSPDKDMRSIPGLLYDPKHPEVGVEEITHSAADRMHLYQTLIGDPVDGYTGCPGMGKAQANKLLDGCSHSSPEAQWGWVLGAFTSRGHSATFALTQARVARILRADDWNSKTKEPILWEPPTNTAPQ